MLPKEDHLRTENEDFITEEHTRNFMICVYISCFTFLELNQSSVRLTQTERSGQLGATLSSLSGGRGFKRRPGDRLSLLRFLVVFLSPSRPVPG